MTIEQKLDWLLDKVRTGEYDLLRQDEKTGKLQDQLLQEKLYAGLAAKPFSDTDLLAQHEWEQLKQKLVDDELIEEFMFSFGSLAVLTIKGKLFEGYTKRKRNELIKNYMRILNLIILSLGTLAAGAYGVFEIWKYYYGDVRP